MNTEISEFDVLIRLAVAIVAGALIGVNRQEHGRPAGLRTTMLVCLAATGAMILANLLVATRGRPWDSYISMDVMRLPLGILTGVGFIGAGAMMHKGNFVLGVTTAATLWFTSVMGLCFGSGEFTLGLLLLVASLGILWGLRWIEKNTKHRYDANVTVVVASEGPAESAIVGTIKEAGYQVSPLLAAVRETGREYRFEVSQHFRHDPSGPPEPLTRLVSENGIREIIWAKQQ
ncbi:MAG TPA: MgtC/SapB family protein [Chthoniobacterales bacterium]